MRAKLERGRTVRRGLAQQRQVLLHGSKLVQMLDALLGARNANMPVAPKIRIMAHVRWEARRQSERVVFGARSVAVEGCQAYSERLTANTKHSLWHVLFELQKDHVQEAFVAEQMCRRRLE